MVTFNSYLNLKNVKMKLVISVLSISWVLFQLSIISFIVVDTIIIRIIHLAFALAIIFLSYRVNEKDQYSSLKKTRKRLFPSFFKFFEKIIFKYKKYHFIFKLILTGLFLTPVLYSCFYKEAIIFRAGNPNIIDIIMGIIIIIGLLEACRRSVGIALSIAASLFIVYLFLDSYGVSLSRFIGQIYMTDEGIYGVPLDVSANIVFLFVLFGSLLEKTGGGKFFIQMSLSIVGSFRGGAAKAAVIGSNLTGMLSGSSIANIVTTGNFTIPLMKKVGYSPKKAAAIEVAASTDGQIMPPIMGAAAFIMAATIPAMTYNGVIKAAFIPAFVSSLTLLYIVDLEAHKNSIRGLNKSECPSLIKTFKQGWYFIIPILILVYQLLIVKTSPAKASFYAIISLMLINIYDKFYQFKNSNANEKIDKILQNLLKEWKLACLSTAKSMTSVALATAGAGIIVGVVSLGLGAEINFIIKRIAGEHWILMLFLTAFFSLILGMGLPTTATYIVMAALIVPTMTEITQAQGLFIPVIALHLFCFYFGILADDTPPVGLAAYAASAISGSKPIPTGIQSFLYDVRTAIIPFMFIFNPDIVLHNINGFSIIIVFLGTLLASFAFASLIQGYFVTYNSWLDKFLLILSCIFLFNPLWLKKLLYFLFESHFFDVHRHWYYSFGFLLFVTAFVKQKYFKLKKAQ